MKSKMNNEENGLCKIYVGQASQIKYKIGEPVLIYRKYTQGNGKRFKSCITSYCVITDLIQVKRRNYFLMTFEELKQRIGNKSVFDEKELLRQYNEYCNVVVMEMLYFGYFGAGNNVNMNWLDNNGCWARQNQYPTDVRLSEGQFKKILMEGKVNVSNVIIN